MEKENAIDLKYTGRAGQYFIYLGKLLRMFIFQNDWKVLPMAAVIAAMVAIAVGPGLFYSMEGTFQGTFALTCVCIWNGFFNSIQAICKERPIVKREHRAGLHITSYVLAHMTYQLILCAAQSYITLFVLGRMGVKFPINGVLAPSEFKPEMFISLLIITYAADMMALMISAIVKTPMAAMTVMPFMLIIQLVFSGFIPLPAKISDASKLMISKWGVQALCVSADYNSLPAVVIWNKMESSGDKIMVGGGISVKDVMETLTEEDMKDVIIDKIREANQRDDFAATEKNLFQSWEYLTWFIIVFSIVTVVFLEFIDRDSR